MVRAEAMREVGLLDEGYFFFFEETDWALRMHRAGWRVCFVPTASIYHFQGQSVGHSLHSRKLFHRSRYRYFRKWHPSSFPFLAALCVLRLAVDAGLNTAATVLTAGRHAGVRTRAGLYAGLLAWHFRGCPAPDREGRDR
jgi:GT2 family glycosyltransferase